MAALQEVIIGNIRLTISAGANPDDRQMTVLGDAQIYDQNVNPTRAYVGDLGSRMTAEDIAFCQGMVDRFISGIMTEFEITQADINEGRDILNNQGGALAPMSLMLPADSGPPVEEEQPPPPSVATAPEPRSTEGGGTLTPPPPPSPTEPVSTESGGGTLTPAIP